MHGSETKLGLANARGSARGRMRAGAHKSPELRGMREQRGRDDDAGAWRRRQAVAAHAAHSTCSTRGLTLPPAQHLHTVHHACFWRH